MDGEDDSHSKMVRNRQIFFNKLKRDSIIYPPTIFTFNNDIVFNIYGIIEPKYQENQTYKKIIVQFGSKRKTFSANSNGEYQISLKLGYGLHKICVFLLNPSKKKTKLGTKYVFVTAREVDSKNFIIKKNYGSILPLTFFNVSINGICNISGIYTDEIGKSPKEVLVRIGNRIEKCNQYDGHEFNHAIKTGCGFKLLKIFAVNSQGSVRTLGYRLFYVFKKPKIILTSRIDNSDYQRWLNLYESPNQEEKENIELLCKSLENGPSFGVFLNGSAPHFDLATGAVNSLEKQYYENWKLCVTAKKELKDKSHNFIINNCSPQNAVQFNFAVGLTNEDYLVFLHPIERLSQHALLEVALSLRENPNLKIIYGDDDEISFGGYRTNPHFKTSFDEIRMLNLNYIGNNFVISRKLFIEIGGFSENSKIDCFHDLLIRASREISKKEIHHIPRILRHRLTYFSKNEIFDDDKRHNTLLKNLPTSTWHICESKGILRVKPPSVKKDDLISIIIPSACNLEYLKPCIDSIKKTTLKYTYEIIILINEIRYKTPSVASYLQSLGKEKNIRLETYNNEPFNFSKLINLGVSQAKGENICLLNDDMEIISEDWIEELISWLSVPAVGAIGARLLFPDKTVQHAGISIGINGVVDHLEKGNLREDAGDFARILYPRQLSAITGGCMAFRKTVFLEIGGLDEKFAEAFNDVDFCIRLQKANFKIVWNPFAELIHHESVSVEKPYVRARRLTFRDEMNELIKRYESMFRIDPHYSSNYSYTKPYFKLAFPPRDLAPWKVKSFPMWSDRKPLNKTLCGVKYDPSKVLIFSHFDLDNKIDDYVLHCIKQFSEIGWKIIFVTSCPILSEQCSDKIFNLVSCILLSDGKGRDWGNYALGLRTAFELSSPKSLIFLNDSVYGPLSSVQHFIEKADSLEADFVGMTDSPQHRYHLQSYFLYFKPSICTHSTFLNYWKFFSPQPNKNLIIQKNEIDFSQYFINLGFRPASLYPYSKLINVAHSGSYISSHLLKQDEHVNPTHYFWDILLNLFDFPFVKVELLRENPSKIPCLSLMKAFLKKNHPEKAKLVFNHLDRIRNR